MQHWSEAALHTVHVKAFPSHHATDITMERFPLITIFEVSAHPVPFSSQLRGSSLGMFLLREGSLSARRSAMGYEMGSDDTADSGRIGRP